MKKITLSVIIIFILVIIIAFVGSNLDTTKAKPKAPVNNISINSNGINHINPPKINLKNLNFNLGQSTKDSFTINEVSKHNSENDCYLIINNKVYDVSSYIGYHPGGLWSIVSFCGKEATGIFARIHSNRAWDLLRRYKIGTIITNKPDTTFQVLTAISDAFKKANPDAEIIRVSPKKDFYVAKIIYQGKLYEVHIDNSGKIINEEAESDWSLWENDKDDN